MVDAVVRITAKGQATIPAQLRAKHGIPAPGVGRWREEGGKLVFEPVDSPRRMRGVLRRAFGKESASGLLLAERRSEKAREKRKLD